MGFIAFQWKMLDVGILATDIELFQEGTMVTYSADQHSIMPHGACITNDGIILFSKPPSRFLQRYEANIFGR